MANYTRLTSGATTFDAMLRRFGVVTVMNVDVFDYEGVKEKIEGKTLPEIYTALYKAEAGTPNIEVHLDTLKVSNITVEGPSKTVTGGQYNNPLLKYGKTARLEMQDALGNADALEVLGGAYIERIEDTAIKPLGTKPSELNTAKDALHVGADFCGPKTLVGDSFFIDQATGQQVPVKIIFFQFLPDSIFNLTQEADGDAAVFDLNGDLLMTNISVGDTAGKPMLHGDFYAIIPAEGYTVTK